MPIPTQKDEESRENFISRCVSNDKTKKEFPDQSQRVAVCMSRAMDGLNISQAADLKYNVETFGFTEDVTEDNFHIPAEAEYEDWGEESEEWDISIAKPGLWENIRKKKQREGDDYDPAKRGDPDRPDPESWKKAQKPNKKADSSEYQGRKVTLNKPFRTPDGPKKRSVYVKNDKGNVVKVNFGDPNMEIKKDNPERRKSFRARHKCDTAPGPKWKARYWSCKMW